MFSFMILDVCDKDKVQHFPYAKIIAIFTYDKCEDAIHKADKYIEKYLSEYFEEGYTENDLKIVFHKFDVDNFIMFKNVVFKTPTFTRQFIVTRV